ncbi:MAG: SAM-dependent methyltransferase [Syntrophaceae bacterium]|nr:SAM-dependent methyltransferase [Syntrophaceae bacterium]
MKEPENKELVKILRERIRAGGPIPFVEFMDLVLYHPGEGYYHSKREKTGPGGDYYTSPHVHPIFGQLLARQLRQMWEILGRPAPFTLVEFGPGKGLLCSDILTYCRTQLGDFYRSLDYVLADISPAGREKQRSLLSPFLQEKKVEWLDPQGLFDRSPARIGCLLSNELIDAFPVHRVQKKDGKLWEIYVACGLDSFQEVFGPRSNPALEKYFVLYGVPLVEGQRAEVNLKALEWIERAFRVLRKGFILTIDYGFDAAELYEPSRRDGTLLCYFRHTTSSNPYERIGNQDITAHVNFTALMKKGEALGLQTVGYAEQFKFLVSLGLLQDLENLERDSPGNSDPGFLKNKLAMRNLLIPGGMGTLFKVLCQSKEVGNVDLLGFQDPFRKP